MTKPIRGSVRLPGDKSISHRALICAAMAAGDSRLTGLGRGTDVGATTACLSRLGATLELSDDRSAARVSGVGERWFREPAQALDCGNSGTAMRLLAGVAASVEGLSILTGDESLARRPMGRVTDPLRAMGAAIDGRDGGRLPPLVVRGGRLTGINHRLRVPSAQVKSALILAGLRAEGRTTITEPLPSRDHTERMLTAAGVEVVTGEDSVAVIGGGRPEPMDLSIPGDISSAFFLIAAAVTVPRSDLEILDVGLNPGRIGGLEVLARMGAEITWAITGTTGGEPLGSVSARTSDLAGVEIPAAAVPGAIDELPMLAVLATQATGTTTIRGAAELRVKESDRIQAVTEGLRILGARVEETSDGMSISGPCRLTGGQVDAHGDHRVAMAFAVANLIAKGEVRIKGWSSVETSFPEFLDLLGRARGNR
ncbi:MAG: 3-phosphoshikimate 1-carboxyvinyltransferase [Actinomycetota bacterium]